MPTGRIYAVVKGSKGDRYKILKYRDSKGKVRQKSLGKLDLDQAHRLVESGGEEVTFEWLEDGEVRLLAGPVDLPPQETLTLETATDCYYGQQRAFDALQAVLEVCRRSPGSPPFNLQRYEDVERRLAVCREILGSCFTSSDGEDQDGQREAGTDVAEDASGRPKLDDLTPGQ